MFVIKNKNGYYRGKGGWFPSIQLAAKFHNVEDASLVINKTIAESFNCIIVDCNCTVVVKACIGRSTVYRTRNSTWSENFQEARHYNYNSKYFDTTMDLLKDNYGDAAIEVEII